MTILTTPAEQLLALGADFTRYNDLVSGIRLYGPDPVTALAEPIATARRLADSALGIVDALGSDQWVCDRALRARVRQLGHLLLESADHLADTVDLLDDTRAGIPVQGEGPLLSVQQSLIAAGRRLPQIHDLTLLGAQDAFDTAELIVAEHRRRGRLPEHRAPALSSAQAAVLRAVARGMVALLNDKPRTYYADIRITISTVRALEARGLVAREKRSLWFSDERAHLTTEGCRALAASFGRPRTPTTARPATTTPAPAVGRTR
ncbi:hypothetical protein [Streptomyces sp. S1]|uniref:hypothetical protein n=1 Tax=Streptomyces sp. S1 TaxID=718288 RepID=UPI003D757D60